MFKFMQDVAAQVAGVAVYGKEAVHSVSNQAQKTPFTILSRPEERWIIPSSGTFVETQTFYFSSDAGPFGFLQIIYSNINPFSDPVHFNIQLHYADGGKTPIVWCSDPVPTLIQDEDGCDIISSTGNCAVTLNPAGDTYTIKSDTNQMASIPEITFKKLVPSFVVGSDGKTLFGTDAKAPWGSMRHSFWPKCEVKGSIITKEGNEVKVDGTGVFVHALQGMKPHHCASRWNFVNFQSPSYSAIMMEFTTPPAYENTVVNVSGIANGSEIIFAGAEGTATHAQVKTDAEVDWPEPTEVKYLFKGVSPDGKDIQAVLKGPLGHRINRVDVMGELPSFFKKLASKASGTRPYIYQYSTEMEIKIQKDGEVEKVEKGLLFAEATFIS